MRERRKLERFDLQTPANIEIDLADGTQQLEGLATKDISSGGAFLVTSVPFPEGAKVKLEFLITMDILRKIVGEGKRTKIKVDGTIVRVDKGGIAIKFDPRYKILTVDNNH